MDEIRVLVAAAVIGFLSLAALYLIPIVDGWYLALTPRNKRTVHIFLGLAFVSLAYVSSCLGILRPLFKWAACTERGLLDAIALFILYVAGISGGAQVIGPTKAGLERALKRNPAPPRAATSVTPADESEVIAPSDSAKG